MILPIDLLLLLFLLIIAVAALWVKDLLAAIVLMGAYSFINTFYLLSNPR